ncbi:hypothetical protein [Mycobacterium sp. AT1]|uniref:hypothetical protein n=1 Tax=Mycobacterium sp. AT1 TaxID=1961706 RepID=UPI001E586CF1|nr:hypothetical protein [Mycobacterium sp. AT1]
MKTVSAPTMASATKLAMVSTTITLSLCRGGAELTYHGVRLGEEGSANCGEADVTDCSVTRLAWLMNPFEKSYTGCHGFRKGTAPMGSFTLVIVRHNGFATFANGRDSRRLSTMI